jgi:O-acetyl-ADP-ribose deacetylase (regulator of RNase III)
MIKYEKGNVFDHLNEPCIFVHGCNAQRTMGSGVAKTIKSTYPEVYVAYIEMDQKLGEVSYVRFDNQVIMCNLISQRNYGYDGKVYVSYKAIYQGLLEIGDMARKLRLPIKMPFIGSGLGGGDFGVLKDIFENTLFDLDVTVFSLEN